MKGYNNLLRRTVSFVQHRRLLLTLLFYLFYIAPLPSSHSAQSLFALSHTSTHCVHGDYQFERTEAGCANDINQKTIPDLNAIARAPQHQISIVASFYNEAPFLLEWIAYHMLLGVDHFYLYDDDSTDGSAEILKPLVQRGLVTTPTVPQSVLEAGVFRTQNFSLRDIGRYFNDTEVIISIDVDEFLFIYPPYTRVQQVLQRPQLRDVGCVKLFRIGHGPNGRLYRRGNDELSVIEYGRAPFSGHETAVFQFGKTIVRTADAVKGDDGVHVHKFPRMKRACANVQGVRNMTRERLMRDNTVMDGVETFAKYPMFIVHHGMRSYEDCVEKAERWKGLEDQSVAWRARAGREMCDNGLKGGDVLDESGVLMRADVPAICEMMWLLNGEYCRRVECCAAYRK